MKEGTKYLLGNKQMNPFKLRVKIGQNEFESEGPEETVKSQYQLFLNSLPPRVDDPDQQAKQRFENSWKWTEIPPLEMEQIFERGEDWSVRLKIKSEPDTAVFDVLVVLIYGIQAYRNLMEGQLQTSKNGMFSGFVDRPATASEITTSFRRSGIEFDRIDRIIFGQRESLIMRGGAKKGSTYSLTTIGRKYAVDLLRRILVKQEK